MFSQGQTARFPSLLLPETEIGMMAKRMSDVLERAFFTQVVISFDFARYLTY